MSYRDEKPSLSVWIYNRSLFFFHDTIDFFRNTPSNIASVGSWIVGKFMFWGLCWVQYFGILIAITIWRGFSSEINTELANYTAESGNPFGHWMVAGLLMFITTFYFGITSKFKYFAGNVIVGLTMAGFFLYYTEGFPAMVWTAGCVLAATSFFFNMYDMYTFNDVFGGEITIFNIDTEIRTDLVLCTVVGLILVWLGECPPSLNN